MDIERLKTTIRDLHDGLEKTGEADPELRRLLQELDEDLHRLLTERNEEAEEESGLQERLESLAADFDSQHPRLAAVLRDLGVALARVGI